MILEGWHQKSFRQGHDAPGRTHPENSATVWHTLQPLGESCELLIEGRSQDADQVGARPGIDPSQPMRQQVLFRHAKDQPGRRDEVCQTRIGNGEQLGNVLIRVPSGSACCGAQTRNGKAPLTLEALGV